MTEVLIHRLTVEDYYLLAEEGRLTPDSRTELLDGQIVNMFPIGPFHSDVVDWLSNLLVDRKRWTVRTQGPLRLSKFSVPEPDIMLLQPRRHNRALPGPKDVYLLIEVADSSLQMDKTKKVPLYAQAGIPEVWVVDVPHALVEVYRDPTAAGYATRTIGRLGGTVSPASFPDVVLKTSEIFAQE
ncbi:MAG TPA: Uma2 family endonuclease [Chthoniobacteraceae bacterium]|nr:Uma2 family endonuclease [Chthoniobacteraceae bacterium]